MYTSVYKCIQSNLYVALSLSISGLNNCTIKNYLPRRKKLLEKILFGIAGLLLANQTRLSSWPFADRWLSTKVREENIISLSIVWSNLSHKNSCLNDKQKMVTNTIKQKGQFPVKLALDFYFDIDIKNFPLSEIL